METFALQLMVRWASDLLSGLVLPLTFFPGVLGTIVQSLPFAAIYWTPLRIYIGELPPSGWAAAIATQCGCGSCCSPPAAPWCGKPGSRRIVVQGG